MFAKAGAAAIGALIDAGKIVIGVVVLIALIGWAKTHPAQAEALVTNAMNTAVALLNKFFNWLSTLGSK